jgi:hypothetical protein
MANDGSREGLSPSQGGCVVVNDGSDNGAVARTMVVALWL